MWYQYLKPSTTYSGAVPEMKSRFLKGLGYGNERQFIESRNELKALNPFAMFDMGDITSLYQDSAGTTPVTQAADPVGLVLDKSQMGGKTAAQFIADQPELLINNDFDSGLNGWTVTNASPPSYQITTSGGILHFEAAGSSPLLRLEALSLSMTTGNYYVLEVDVAELNSGTLKFDMNGEAPEIVNKVGINRSIFKADRDYLRFYRQSNPVDIKIASISLKEIPGQHLTQATASQRPLYQADGSLLFDGVDDNIGLEFAGGAGPSDGAVIYMQKPFGGSWTMVSEENQDFSGDSSYSFPIGVKRYVGAHILHCEQSTLDANRSLITQWMNEGLS
jgi:hypothetical protein